MFIFMVEDVGRYDGSYLLIGCRAAGGSTASIARWCKYVQPKTFLVLLRFHGRNIPAWVCRLLHLVLFVGRLMYNIFSQRFGARSVTNAKVFCVIHRSLLTDGAKNNYFATKKIKTGFHLDGTTQIYAFMGTAYPLF